MALTGYNNVLELTIDSSKVDSDLSNFPVLIALSSGTGINSFDATPVFDELGSNSKKIAVADSNDNQFYVEIERWDDTVEEAYLWTKVSTISGSIDTKIYLYYDATVSDNTAYVGDTGDTAAQNVWDDDFVAVFHMAQDPNGDVANSVKDSTSNSNDASPSGSMTSGDLVDSKIGKGIDFDGNNDGLSMGDLDVHNNTAYTVEVIVNGPPQNNKRFFAESYSGTPAYPFFTFGSDYSSPYNKAKVFIRDNNSTVRSQAACNDVVMDSTPHYAVWVDNNGSYNFYVDGSGSGSGSYTKNTKNTNYSDIAFYGANGGGAYLQAVLDEVRLSKTNRSAAWIKATYYSNWNDLITFSSAEAGTIYPSIFINGQWVNVEGVWIYIDSQWRTVDEMKIYIQGAWRSLV